LSLSETMLKAAGSLSIINSSEPSMAHDSWESYVNCLLN
jgi:hypothetical protein